MIDLSWGESQCVRDALAKEIDPTKLIPIGLENIGYPPHEGNSKLIELTDQVILRQTGNKYKHVFLTNGATGAVTIALRAYLPDSYSSVILSDDPYFPLYPSMIFAAGFTKYKQARSYQELDLGFNSERDVLLIDSPSNPKGRVLGPNCVLPLNRKIVFDAVYHNRVYSSGGPTFRHDILCGSYSKLLGINGVRIGWLATNDDYIKDRIYNLITAEYAGLSVPSQNLLESILGKLDWDTFEKGAKGNLDDNRTEWTKLERFFNEETVPANGMFFYGGMDQSCVKLLEKSNIKWMPGSKCGTHDSFGRFNLGQSCKTIKSAVKQILKNDKI